MLTNRFIPLLTIAVLCVMVVGCAITAQENLRNKLNSWVGHHVDELVVKLGPPHRSSPTLKDGGRVVEYAWSAGTSMPDYSQPPSRRTKRNDPSSCVMSFTLNSSGQIESGSTRGNCS